MALVTLFLSAPELTGILADANGEWVCGCAAKASLLMPHSVGHVEHPDGTAHKSGNGMTYRTTTPPFCACVRARRTQANCRRAFGNSFGRRNDRIRERGMSWKS